MKRRTLLLLAGLPLVASAHGPQAHDGKPGSKPSTKPKLAAEQTAWGMAGEPRQVSRTLEILMDDRMRFTPDLIEVREGETLRLRLRNQGKILHELVIGTAEELDKHARLMEKFPDMEHDEPWMAHVDPGKRGELVWQFNRAGNFEFACLIPGHYQAGMKGRILVRPR